MRRTEWLQKTRRMRFEDVYGRWQARRLTQEEAGKVLGGRFRRYVDRHEEQGMEGLRDKRLTQASARKAPGAEVQDVVERYRSRHDGWNASQGVPSFADNRGTPEDLRRQVWQLLARVRERNRLS